MLTGASLDEQCLLNSVKQTGLAQFKQRSAKAIVIELAGLDTEFDLISLNEFTSERKLMSVLVRDRRSGQLFVYAKGAESQIMNRLSAESRASPLSEQVAREIVRFGSAGLRTLVFAMRQLDTSEFESIDLSD